MPTTAHTPQLTITRTEIGRRTKIGNRLRRGIFWWRREIFSDSFVVHFRLWEAVIVVIGERLVCDIAWIESRSVDGLGEGNSFVSFLAIFY